jgi:hypothetical protein
VIDFRYHLVSIIAVFLALAIGIVLGSTELQGPVYNALRGTSNALQDKLTNADNEIQADQLTQSADAAFEQANEAGLLSAQLAGQKLLFITEPGFQSSVINGLTTAATDAGATVTGQINLGQNFFSNSSSTSATLSALNSRLATQTGIQMDSTVQWQQQAAMQVLAGALLTGITSSTIQQNGAISPANVSTIVQAYGQAGYLTTSGTPTAAKATLVVLVTPQTPPSDGTTDLLAQAVAPMAQELYGNAYAVVVGSAAGSGAESPMSVFRGSSQAQNISSVDDADTTKGQIAVMQALHIAVNHGKAGSYGLNGSSPAYPAATPSPSTSPSATPSATKKPKR